MIIIVETDGGMIFSFNDFLSAFEVDKQGEKDSARFKYNGSSIVDIIAESADTLCFIEAKNFVNKSDDPTKQAAIDKAQADSYADLSNAPNYAKGMIKKLERALFVWLASGNPIDKPIAFILAFNFGAQFDKNLKRILHDRLNEYIPNPRYNQLLNTASPVSVLFDIPDIAEANDYGFSITVQS
ncbi:MAG: hypothetical protein LBK98_09380 [Peptococcaceae bacterium]|jgi:hypothetical protein|nr:hypothetical protein [Peptococcaceae bacterium]